ncbi:MAG: MOSC domain-containing protein [Armatimonadota bacterium]|nr:MOSC domain-containing protein [Armatimonadota bacterium]
MLLVSLQIGPPRSHVSSIQDGNDAAWVSGIWKGPVSGRVHLDWAKLDGDGQADLKNHGGPDKAVCCYAAAHYPAWRTELGRTDDEFPHGAFGENFTWTDAVEEGICIGDIYTVGTARVQVSQPRMPCWKLGRRWERPGLPLEASTSGRTGWYLRVLEPGEVGAGDMLALIERPLPLWSVARVNQAMYVEKNDADMAEELSQLALLAEAWRRPFRRRAGLLRSRMG